MTVTKVRVFSISGFSRTGKTVLVSQLIEELRRRGYTVASLKSTSRDVFPPEGTDTRSHWDAGCEVSVLLGPKTTTIRYRKRVDPRTIIEESQFDFLLIEGAKTSNAPKFWCIGIWEENLEDLPKNVKAIVRWGKALGLEFQTKDLEVPILFSEDISRLTDIIEKEAIPLKLLEV